MLFHCCVWDKTNEIKPLLNAPKSVFDKSALLFYVLIYTQKSKFKIQNNMKVVFSHMQMKQMYQHLKNTICTLISENHGLEKARSASNLRKISGIANLNSFLGLHQEKKLNLYHKPDKIQVTHWKKNPGVQDLKFF